MNGRGEKTEIKMCREEKQRRIKWRGAYDGLAGLQKLPAAIQLLLKATFEKSLLVVPTIQDGSKETEKETDRVKNGREGESEKGNLAGDEEQKGRM